MAVSFRTADGRTGQLDVVSHIKQAFNGRVTGVKDGLIMFRTEDGGVHAFSLAHWANEAQAQILSINGFNAPGNALDQPPNGMNYVDQAAFFHDGQNLEALSEMFQKAVKLADERVVVLDNDGLWKTMWSPFLKAPLPPAGPLDGALAGEHNDPRLVIREAGIALLFGLCSMDAPKNERGVEVGALVEALKILSRNCPYENKFQIGKIMNQTTGIDPWKFYNALLAPEEVGAWLQKAMSMRSFDYRMLQMQMAEVIVKGMHAQAQKDFMMSIKEVYKLDETKSLMLNLKTICMEFIQFLVGLNLLRDISKTTGLDEWVSLSRDTAIDPSQLPPMPDFVESFVTLLKWMMPIASDPKLAMASGKKGFKACTNLLTMADNCIFSLAGVPDSSAKYKMFMALRRLQTQIENKLSFHYQPAPEDNPDGLKENPFMQVKGIYAAKRDEVYRLCQVPRESWNNTILDSLRQIEDLERFYESLHPSFAEVFRSFVAMDAAYDMQPWTDVGHAERTHDSFAMNMESFGAPPPEAGYLAKNSVRAVNVIAETLVESAGFLAAKSEAEIRHILRNPMLLATLLKNIMVAAVNREVGTVEVLSKFGFLKDPGASPDPERIWEDPDVVIQDQMQQVQELMGAMAMEQMATQQAQQDEEAEATGMQEAMRDEGQAQKAGAGPMGNPQRAMAARGGR